MVRQRSVVQPLHYLKCRMKTRARKLAEVGDQDHHAAPQVGVAGAARQLARVQASPVVKRTLSQRGVALALHLDVHLLAAFEPDPDIQGDALVLHARPFRLRVQYLDRLDRSVTLAVRILAERVDAPESAFAPTTAGGGSTVIRSRQAAGLGASVGGSREPSPARGTARARTRQVILRNTANEEVPLFTQLTAFYVGMFAASVLALTILALKEYAKGELGLTERELILGRGPDA